MFKSGKKARKQQGEMTKGRIGVGHILTTGKIE